MSNVYVIALVVCKFTRIKWVCLQFTLLKLLFPLLGCVFFLKGGGGIYCSDKYTTYI